MRHRLLDDLELGRLVEHVGQHALDAIRVRHLNDRPVLLVAAARERLEHLRQLVRQLGQRKVHRVLSVEKRVACLELRQRRLGRGRDPDRVGNVERARAQRASRVEHIEEGLVEVAPRRLGLLLKLEDPAADLLRTVRHQRLGVLVALQHHAEAGRVAGAHARKRVVHQVLDALQQWHRGLSELGCPLQLRRVPGILAVKGEVDQQGEEADHCEGAQVVRLEIRSLLQDAGERGRNGRKGEGRDEGGAGLGREIQ